MNAIEDRLREALRERAMHFPTDPDAWERTVARTRRPARGGPWSRFAIPAAAAAAVVAIVAGATVLTGRVGTHAGGPSSASPSVTLPGPLGRNDYLIQQDPPVSEIVPVNITAGGQVKRVYVWFARMKGDAGKGTMLCSEIWQQQTVNAAICQSVQISAQQVAVFTSGDSTIKLGASSRQVTSVSAQLPGGRAAAGKLVSGRGFPAKVWLVSYPLQDDAGIVFHDAAGHQIGHLTIAGAPVFPRAQPQHGGITVFRNAAGTTTAYLMGGQVNFWSSPSAASSFSNVPASGPPEVGGFTAQDFDSYTWSEFYGYAHGNVARVTVRMADGRQFGGQTFPGWKGSGIRLFAFPGPARLVLRPKYVMLAYDAAGHVIWQATIG
jgi:hypothetical protein